MKPWERYQSTPQQPQMNATDMSVIGALTGNDRLSNVGKALTEQEKLGVERTKQQAELQKMESDRRKAEDTRRTALAGVDSMIERSREILNQGPPIKELGIEGQPLRSLVGKTDLERTTGAQSWVPTMPGSGPANVEADIEFLKSRAVLDTMNQLKQQSQTGATGFGATQRNEIEIMERSLANIQNLSQSDEEYQKEIIRFMNAAQRMRNSFSAEQDGPKFLGFE